jgi:hypothetical protein
MTFPLIYLLTGLILAPFSYAMLLAYAFEEGEPRFDDKLAIGFISLLTAVNPLCFIGLYYYSDFARLGLRWK